MSRRILREPAFVPRFWPGRGWMVADAGSRAIAAGPLASREAARSLAAEMEARRDRALRRGARPCLCCGETFNSEGIHNRLCASCRWQG